jgi:hypothetical protein
MFSFLMNYKVSVVKNQKVKAGVSVLAVLKEE